MKLAHGGKTRRRGDDEDGPLLGQRLEKGGQETERRRQIERRSGMNLMHAGERKALPGKVLVESRKPEGKEPPGA